MQKNYKRLYRKLLRAARNWICSEYYFRCGPRAFHDVTVMNSYLRNERLLRKRVTGFGDLEKAAIAAGAVQPLRKKEKRKS